MLAYGNPKGNGCWVSVLIVLNANPSRCSALPFKCSSFLLRFFLIAIPASRPKAELVTKLESEIVKDMALGYPAPTLLMMQLAAPPVNLNSRLTLCHAP